MTSCGDRGPSIDASVALDAPVDVGLAPDASAADGGVRSFHCAFDESCPAVDIAGDPIAVSPFRGYGDPSLERDPATGTLWLSYSWLEARVEGSAEADLTVVTHLARSEDGARTFTFVRAVNGTEVLDGPRGGRGWWMHEVSSLARSESGWRLVTLDYLDPVGAGERDFFHFARTRAAVPEGLGDSSERWVGVAAGVTPLEVAYDVHAISGLSDCAVLTEPAVFTHDGTDWLAASCVVVDGTGRRSERERVVLLRETETSLVNVGALFTAEDAQAVGADRFEQIDLSVARDGTLIALVTPVLDDEEPFHRGCLAYEVEDLASARVRRDASGRAVPRLVLTADGTGLGPGLCTYDAASDVGVLLVITDFDLSVTPPRLVFSLRATGIQP